MSIVKQSIIATLFIFSSILGEPGCIKQKKEINSSSGFILSSPAIGSDSLLPADYTCKGSSESLPLRWEGVPDGTMSLAMIMHHEASPTDIHCYWILYNLSTDVDSLPRNATGIGTLGINSVNKKMQYTPPCSQGPGTRDYIFTLYALSKKPVIEVAPDSVNRTVILNTIRDITISSTIMKVYYIWSNK